MWKWLYIYVIKMWHSRNWGIFRRLKLVLLVRNHILFQWIQQIYYLNKKQALTWRISYFISKDRHCNLKLKFSSLRLRCLDLWFYCSQSLDIECTSWRLSQKRVVRTKFNIYALIKNFDIRLRFYQTNIIYLFCWS
jgi:hypothetical protein